MEVRKKKILTVFIIILFICFCGLVLFLSNQQSEFREEQDVVEIIKQEVVEEPESDFEEEEYVDKYLLRKVNFDRLQAINDDVSTWLYIPGTNIDSYVMQEPVLNKYKYDKKNIYKNYTSTGSFLIPKEPMDLDDAHTLILGHHMPYNSNAFGNLVSYYRKSSDNYSNVYLYYPDHSERWTVWLVADVKDDDMLYELPYEYGTEHYRDLLEHLEDKARYVNSDRPDLFTNILCLSTCNRWNRQTLGRFVVVCKPDAYYYYDDKEYIDFVDLHATQMYEMSHNNDYDDDGNPTEYIVN